jgi:hypothetical protein
MVDKSGLLAQKVGMRDEKQTEVYVLFKKGALSRELMDWIGSV